MIVFCCCLLIWICKNVLRWSVRGCVIVLLFLNVVSVSWSVFCVWRRKLRFLKVRILSWCLLLVCCVSRWCSLNRKFLVMLIVVVSCCFSIRFWCIEFECGVYVWISCGGGAPRIFLRFGVFGFDKLDFF